MIVINPNWGLRPILTFIAVAAAACAGAAISQINWDPIGSRETGPACLFVLIAIVALYAVRYGYALFLDPEGRWLIVVPLGRSIAKAKMIPLPENTQVVRSRAPSLGDRQIVQILTPDRAIRLGIFWANDPQIEQVEQAVAKSRRS